MSPPSDSTPVEISRGRSLPRNPTREIVIGSLTIGNGHPIAPQSMCATRTRDVEATSGQIQQLVDAGASVVRIAVDSKRDAEAVEKIAGEVEANICADLQENYKLASNLAPHLAKIRYNPGHLYHHEPEKPWQDKVRYIAEMATKGDCALRIGVNCGSVDPAKSSAFDKGDSVAPMVASALEHSEFLDSIGFTRYCVSLKDSDPNKVVEANLRFSAQKPEVPIHLGVTEAGLPPDGIIKTRVAFEQLISRGIGDTIRVSLTVPNERKAEEIVAAHEILEDIYSGRVRSVVHYQDSGINVISCPSCSRVENSAFVELAEKVKELTLNLGEHDITVAVMGCRVNGPGETDDADLGLWCAPSFVNLKRGTEKIGAFPYDEILEKLEEELDRLITAQKTV
ncbi:MAG TPA: flavodoxin-dependent (E)-4-hydroxy-3-methylbut-2-enyl-diphosphate synthase [Planctomycetes bacterium]|nr:flavodoxin-dependent (E)-4-hydroxy-3-methylbut-2-enyl-diphosphate synthase [Planctomycetota bacterium]HIN79735.1 flavodoxin-dependent (E)-4-hydroxy-3-methylbut-2-enyl-diphosphate synthase [Planctomycetota bacterium]